MCGCLVVDVLADVLFGVVIWLAHLKIGAEWLVGIAVIVAGSLAIVGTFHLSLLILRHTRYGRDSLRATETPDDETPGKAGPAGKE